MADVVGVVFRNGAKTYHFDSAGLELSHGDRVVVQTINGVEIGQVVEPPRPLEDAESSVPFKKVLRLATGEDLRAQAGSESIRKEAMIACRDLIVAHGLDMKLVDAEVSFGGDKITFSFYSDERVDFRALVTDLAKALKRRIELRQIGAREEARMLGGLGACGRSLCCSLFHVSDEPVSIRMAKEQNLPLNPGKISGLCGRLMCCLKYEQDQYVTFRKEAPPKGTRVKWGEAEGAITGYNVLKDAVVVRFEDGSSSDVRLSGCRLGEDGCLNCPREVEQPKPAVAPRASYDSRPGLPGLQVAGGGGDARSDPTPVGGAAVDAARTEDGTRAEAKSRSRRSRGRRAGRGRGLDATAATPNGSANAAADAAADVAETGGPRGGPVDGGTTGAGEGRPGRRPPRRRSGSRVERPTGSPKAGPRDREPAADVAEAGGETEIKRARRRRRPRRRGSGPSEGGPDRGSGGGDVAGAPGGGS